MKHSENFLQLSQRLGYSEPPKNVKSVLGGCIHNSSILEFKDGKKVFLKQNNPNALSVLEAEHEALLTLHSSHAICVPEPFFCHVDSDLGAILVMEHLELQSLDEISASDLGEQLTELHSVFGSSFGFRNNNYIGATPQKNTPNDCWGDFFWNQRLQFQFHLASRNGFNFRNISRLEKAVEKLLKDHNPTKSLLHGDLWGGNAASLKNAKGVVFDPASYYGDPETDIAFTEVFGGFPPEFYEAYKHNANWDKAGYAERKDVYNLYHYLNHLNLFGSGYYSTCERIIEKTIHRHG